MQAPDDPEEKGDGEGCGNKEEEFDVVLGHEGSPKRRVPGSRFGVGRTAMEPGHHQKKPLGVKMGKSSCKGFVKGRRGRRQAAVDVRGGAALLDTQEAARFLS